MSPCTLDALESRRAGQRESLQHLTLRGHQIGQQIVAEGRALTAGERLDLATLRRLKTQLHDTLAQIREYTRSAVQAAPPGDVLTSC